VLEKGSAGKLGVLEKGSAGKLGVLGPLVRRCPLCPPNTGTHPTFSEGRNKLLLNYNNPLNRRIQDRLKFLSVITATMTFDLYIPENLEFRDYIAIVQTARTFADGYDKKVYESLPVISK
jgi:hypothetical protein